MTTTRRGKPLSPRSPARNLEISLGNARKVYKSYAHGTFTKGEVAHALKCSAISGAFITTLFSLKEFGLLDLVGKDFKMSKWFLELDSAKQGTEKFKEAALRSIRNSAMLDALLNEFKDQLPSRDVVANRLETRRKFNKEKAKQVAKVLENSLQFAGILGSSNQILPVRASEGVGEVEDSGNEDTPDHEITGRLKLELPLSDRRTLTIFYPPDLKSAEANKVATVLKAIVG